MRAVQLVTHDWNAASKSLAAKSLRPRWPDAAAPSSSTPRLLVGATAPTREGPRPMQAQSHSVVLEVTVTRGERATGAWWRAHKGGRPPRARAASTIAGHGSRT